MKKVIFFITLVMFLFLSLSSENKGMDSSVSKKVEETLNKITDTMEQAALDGDHPTIMKYYTDDLIIMPNFREPVRGKKELRELYKMEKEQNLKYHSFSSQVEKRWEDEGNIYEYGSFGLAFSFNSVEKPTAYHGSYFQIWEMVEGSYKIKYAIWNLDHNPF